MIKLHFSRSLDCGNALMIACHRSSWTIARRARVDGGCAACHPVPCRTRPFGHLDGDCDRLAEGVPKLFVARVRAARCKQGEVCMVSSLLQAQKHAAT